MNNRTMATVYVNQDSISVKTCSRKGCSPQRFIILKKELQRLEEKKYLITKDIHSYAELRLCDAVGGAKVLELSFTWLKDAGRDSVSGYTERIRLPYEPFRCFAHMRQVRKKSPMEHGGGCCPFRNRTGQSWSFTAGRISRP